MALSSGITTKSVTQIQPNLMSVTFNLQYKDGDTVLLDQDFSCQTVYPVDEWATKNAFIRKQMKAALQKYKNEQIVLNSAGLATVITNLNANVGV